ncbi:MAG: histidine kinase, partial [Actinomycetota bacterium]|nr:histidine kinase [Actinomycetota bacterium]
MLASALLGIWSLIAHLSTGWPSHRSLVLAIASLPLVLALVLGTTWPSSIRVDPVLAGTVHLVGLTALVVGVGVVLLLTLDRVPTPEDRALLGLSMLMAGIAALAYVPLHARISAIADRLVHGGRRAPEQVLRTFRSRLSRAIPLDELLLQVAETLRATLALDRAEVWTGSDGLFERATSMPDAPEAHLSLRPEEEKAMVHAGVSGMGWARVWLPELVPGGEEAEVRVAPVAHAAKLLGLIVCVRPPDGDRFTEEEERVLTELARQLGLVLHNVRLDAALQASLDELRNKADELEASRARIVAASDAARRRIERDLHDGAQQHLIGLVAQLRLALQLGRRDRVAGDEMLEQVGRGLQDAVQQLRSLAHGIYPPLLVERGLNEALAAAAARAGIQTQVEVTVRGRYPPELEAAVYFCCLEALQNVVKHAGGDAKVTVRVWEES